MKKMRFSSEFIIKAIETIEIDSLCKIGFFEVLSASILETSYNENDVTSALIEIKLKQYTRFNENYMKVNVYVSNEKIVINDYEND